MAAVGAGGDDVSGDEVPDEGAAERPDYLELSRLSGTAGPGHGNDFAAPDVEADAVENAKLVVALDNISDFNHSAKLRKNPNDSKVSSSNSVLWRFVFLFCGKTAIRYHYAVGTTPINGCGRGVRRHVAGVYTA